MIPLEARVVTHRLHRRDDLAGLLDALARWDADGEPVPGLHVGDVGWALRDPDDAAVATYRAAGFALVAEATAVWLDRRRP